MRAVLHEPNGHNSIWSIVYAVHWLPGVPAMRHGWACIHRGGQECYYHDPSSTCVAAVLFEEPESFDDCCDADAMCILPRGAEEQTMCVLPTDLIGRNVQDGCNGRGQCLGEEIERKKEKDHIYEG